MKMSVLYHSKSGNTQRRGEIIAEGMAGVVAAEARAFSLDALDEDWVKGSRCVVLGTPIYLASMTGIVKTWLETEARKYGLGGKLGGAFATAG